MIEQRGARARAPAADPGNETLFAARTALKRGLAMRAAAELQVKQIRVLVTRLEEELRTGS